MGLFNLFNKKSIVTQKTYTCARCKKEITDAETKWIGNHRFCNKCAAPTKANNSIQTEKKIIDNSSTIHPQKISAINKCALQKETTIRNPVKIECVFDLQAVDINFKNNVEYVLERESEYVKEGKWNTETFLKLAKACTGKIDGVDYYGFAQSKASVGVWGKIFGGEHIHKNGGKYSYNPDSKYIAGVQFCYDLIHTHKVTNNMKATFTDGNVAMTLSTCWFSDMKNSIPEKDAGWTYLPKGPGESEYYCNYDSVECWAIPTTVKNPEIIADIMADYVYPTKGTDYVADTLKSQFFDEESYNTAYAAAKLAQKTSVLTPRYDYITKNIGWNWHGIDKKQSPQAYFASVKAQAQACLDDVWDQK